MWLLYGHSSLCANTWISLSDAQTGSWGNNTFGQLGLGDTMRRGSLASEMGDALPEVALGTEVTRAEMIGAAWHHTCAILENSDVKCWGEGMLFEFSAAYSDGPARMPPISKNIIIA